MGELANALRYGNVTVEKKLKQRRFALLREKRIRAGRETLWEFCRATDDAEFYSQDKWHLRVMCETLQALYEKRLTKQTFRNICDKYAPAWYAETVDWERLIDDYVYTRVMENLPPRVGKSRTLVNFCKWVFGKSKRNKIITGSYNDEMAQDFSRYTRDGIQQVKTYPHEIVYSDVFPETEIKRGDASFGKWALEGTFFSYKGAGVGGSVTGKGCNISIVDDPVKDAEEAFNDNRLETIWRWYSGTFKSRREKGSIEIVNMTRWAKKDICGRILDNEKRAKEWFILRMEAMDPTTKEMLCPALFDREMYEESRDTIDEAIFNANFHQQPVDKKGRLYKEFRTYTDIPHDDKGNAVFERVIAYTDTADMGGDRLATIIGGQYKGQIYILDVLYTAAGMEETEPATADILFSNNVNFAKIESNNGGRGFARNVTQLIWERHKTRSVTIQWFHQTKNKEARIRVAATFVMNNMFFPVNWRDRWPEYYRDMTEFKAEGKNAHDDAPDATTGLAEMVLDTTGKQVRAAKSIY